MVAGRSPPPPFPSDMNIILFLIIIRIINIFSIYEGKFVLLVGRSTPPFKVFRYQHLPPTPPHKKNFSIYEEKFVLLVGRSTPPFKIFRYQYLSPTPPHKENFSIYEEKFVVLAGRGFV